MYKDLSLYVYPYYLNVRAFLSAYYLLLHHLTAWNHLPQAAKGNDR